MEEINIERLSKIFRKNWKTIIFATIFFLVISLIVSLSLPKTFESDTLIKLGKSNGQLVYSAVDAKNLIKSSDVLGSALSKFSTEKDPIIEKDFTNNNLKIELVSEIIVPSYPTTSSFIRITAKTNNATKSRDIALAIANSYLEYENKELKNKKDLLAEEYNLFVTQKKSEFEIQANNLKKQIEENNAKIETIQKQISEIDSQIKSIQSDQNSSTTSETLVLLSIRNNYNSRLDVQENKKADLEEQLIDKKIGLDQELVSKKIEFDRNNATFEYAKIVSLPTIAKSYSNPNILINVIIGGIVGLLLSILYFTITKK